MSRRPQLVRLIGSCLSLLVGALFCQQFSRFQFDALVQGAGFPQEDLTILCNWFLSYSPILLALPMLMLWLGLVLLFRSQGPSGMVELCAQVALVLAFILVVICILAWQVPYAIPAGVSF
jgi:hypothetical protein